MKSLSFVLVGFLITALFYGCGGGYDDYTFSGGGTETIGIEWKGEQSVAPSDPDTNWVYFDKNDNTSYIWSGHSWDTLAVSGTESPVNMDGIDGVKLIWKGVHSAAPQNPEYHWAYYDRLLRGSYIWDSTAWAVLTKDTDGNSALIWKGNFDTAPLNPQKNWAYYDTVKKKSYLFNGTEWIVLDQEEEEEIEKIPAIKWKGALATPPITPEPCWLYYNTTDSSSYIYAEFNWRIFAPNSLIDAVSGLDGMSIVWKGDLSSAPTNPVLNWGYFDTVLNGSFLWNGTEWAVLYLDDGSSTYFWMGTFATALLYPEKNWIYFNTTDKKSYLFDGSVWELLDRDKVEEKKNNPTLLWQGSYNTHPVSPDLYWMYNNTMDKGTYIYNGIAWDTLAPNCTNSNISGLDGLSVVWKGTFDSSPDNPQLNWSYYDTNLKGSFRWSGSKWTTLYIDTSSTPCIWEGTLPTAPATPSLSVAYFNTNDQKSYLFDGNNWTEFTRDYVKELQKARTIIWKGSLSAPPYDPMTNWLYTNQVDSITYIFEGSNWDIFGLRSFESDVSGLSGLPLQWKGLLSSAPQNPKLFLGYYDTVLKASLIWNGTEWAVLYFDDTEHPKSWVGSWEKAPSDPLVNWCYFNYDEVRSYSYDGSQWNVLDRDSL